MSGPASSIQRPASGGTLAVIASQFPELHETFVVRELVALRDAGIPLRIYSLKRCRDRIVHPEAEALLSITEYCAWDDPRVWLQGLQQLIMHPIHALTSLGWTVRHHGLNSLAVAKSILVWLQAMALARRMQREGVLHVHAHWATMPTTAAAIISRWTSIPFSFTAHAWDLFVANPSLPEKVRLASRVITCTEYNRRHLAQWCPEEQKKIILNYHGVDINQFQQPAEFGVRNSEFGVEAGHSELRTPNSELRTPLLLSVGRLVETKGFDTLLRAYYVLKRRHQSFRAVIVGQGPQRAALERRTRALGLAGCVELRPSMSRQELQALYVQAAAFVLPSVIAPNGDRDGIPNVILEAMAMRLPVVSTTISGIPEAVQDRRTGLLVPPGDAAALAHALEALLRRPALRRVMGDQGRMWAETQFGAREHMQRLVGQVQELLEGARGKGQGAGERSETSPCPPSPAPRPLQVMYVIWSLGLGGAEQVVLRLAAGLHRDRFTPIICCLNEPGPFAKQAEDAGIEVVALHKRGAWDLSVVPKLTRLMRARHIRVVHTHLWGANLWGRLAARRASVPVIIATEHNVDTWKSPLHFMLDRWLAPKTTTLIAVSKQVREFYEAQGVAPGRWQVLYNGIDSAQGAQRRREAAYQGLGIHNGEPVVGLVGRLVPAKAPSVFIQAIDRARQQLPSIKALIIGDGPLRAEVEAEVKRLKLEPHVIFTGLRHDVPELLAGMDALAFSSEREGLSMAMLEAMAAGVPVVATRVGGNPELIDSGTTGVLVPPRDPEALAEALVKILTDPVHADAIRAAALRRIREQFSLTRMVEAHQSLYAPH